MTKVDEELIAMACDADLRTKQKELFAEPRRREYYSIERIESWSND